MFDVNINNVAFDFFGFPIHWYALAYIFGIIIGFFLAQKMSAKLNLKITKEHLDNFINLCVLSILIGGRFGHVLFYDFRFYFYNPLEIFKIWHGGMSFFGGFLGMLFATCYFCKKNRIDILNFTDILSISAPIGLFLGRIANFINGELLGRYSDIWCSVRFSDGISRHPSQLYEALSEGLILFIVMIYISYNCKYRTGFLSGMFCALYGIFRIMCEFFREPDSELSMYLLKNFEITLNQIFCIPMIIFGIFLIYNSKKSEKIDGK